MEIFTPINYGYFCLLKSPPSSSTKSKYCYKETVFYLSLTTTDVLAVGSEGSDEVAGGQEAVLVCVHDAEGLLELLDGGLGEGVEDVGFLRHDGGGGEAGMVLG